MRIHNRHTRRWHTTLPRLQMLTLFLALSTVVAGCGKTQALPQQSAPEVTVMTVTPRDTPVNSNSPRRPKLARSQIRARVDGFLDRRTYVEGSLVKSRADHVPDGPQAVRGRAADGQGTAGAAAGAAIRWRRPNLARVQPLVAQNALSKKDLDDAIGSEEQAAAAVIAAKGEVRDRRS